MLVARWICATWLLLGGLLCSAPAAAQNLVLTRDCEDGFRQLMRMAQKGRFGEDVSNANVGVSKDRVRVELVGPGALSKVLLLAPRKSAAAAGGYFDVSAGPGATAADVARVGEALDRIFAADPFLRAGVEVPPGGALPGLAEAWAADSWRGVGRALERRMMVLASLPYTIGVIAGLALALLAALALLWTSTPACGRR